MLKVFSARLKWLREKHGYSQRDMAEKLGISQPYYGRFEKGTAQPNLDTLFRLRMLFNEPLDFIVGVHIEDIKAEKLYGLYIEARLNREEIEEYIKESYELFNDKESDDKEWILKSILTYKDDLKKMILKEEKALDLFYNYVLTIPGTIDEFRDKEFWIKRFEKSKEERVLLETEFDEEFEKL